MGGENNLLKITLVIFMLLFIGAGVSTVLLFKKADELQKDLDGKIAAANDANRAKEEAITERKRIAVLIKGVDSDEPETLEKLLEEDIATYVATAPADATNFHEAIVNLNQLVIKHQQAVVEKESQIATLNQRIQEIESVKQPQIVQANTAQQAADQEKNSVQAKFAKDLNDLQAQNKQIASAAKASEEAIQKEQKVARDKVAAAEAETRKWQKDFQRSKEYRENERPQVDKSIDGAITWTDQATRRCYINLGTSDGLKPGTVFAVHREGITDPTATDTIKGKIEVVRNLNSKLSECRILEDELGDPLLAGDVIYTNIWRPGWVDHFALGNMLDINDDGRSDAELVRNMILKSGGKIDAYVDEKGNIVGEITPRTTYYIDGLMPKLGQAAPAVNQRIAKSSKKLSDDARKWSAQVISLSQLMDIVGYSDTLVDRAGEDFNLSIGQRRRATKTDVNAAQVFKFKKKLPPNLEGKDAKADY